MAEISSSFVAALARHLAKVFEYLIDGNLANWEMPAYPTFRKPRDTVAVALRKAQVVGDYDGGGAARPNVGGDGGANNA